MARVVLSPRAQQDLDEIWDYSLKQWGEDRAEAYLRGLWAGMRVVAEDSRRGAPFEFREGYLRFSVGSHVLFFKRIADGVDIIRILHQRMNFGRHQ